MGRMSGYISLKELTMPVYYTPLPDFHSPIIKQLKEWKKDPNKEHFYIKYRIIPLPGNKQEPEVLIGYTVGNSTMYKEKIVNIPKSYSPYSTWKDWFTGYLEDQIVYIGNEIGETIYVNRGGKLVLPERKEFK
jgi:hypothetical protein